MLLPDIGGFGYDQALAVATRTFTPLFDRAAVARRINISNPSAADNWTISVGGRVLATFRELALGIGNQHLLRVSDSDVRPKLDFWEYCRNTLGIDASIPIPNGQGITVASVGGATADINVEYLETDVPSQNVKGLQHYLGNVFLIPITWYLNASQSLPGAFQVDTQVSPAWVPPIFSAVGLPVNWKVEILSLFLEGMGVNTFSGAANHQSVTQDVRVFRDNVQMFTRQGLGIPNEGSASAAGSANTVFGQRSGIFRPFELQSFTDDGVLPAPIVLNGGDVMQLFIELTGDLTGGAAYANAMIVGICRVTVPVGG